MFTKCRWTGRQILKPGLKLIGAKTKSRDLLYQLMKPHDIYVEPFAGSTTVLVGKAPAAMEFIGDTNSYLVDYVKTLQSPELSEEFWSIFEFHLVKLHNEGKEHFLYMRDWVTKTIPRYERAVFFYMISKACMNGVWRQRKDGKVNSSYCGQSTGRGWFSREWFDKVVDRYSEVTALNCPYQETIEFANDFNGNQFLFLDPPYRYRRESNGAGTVTTYNGQRFLDKDLEELREVMDNFPGDILMTINDDEWTRRLFHEYCIVPHEISYSCSQTNSGRGAHPELLVANYEIKSKFQELKSQLEDAKKEAKTGAVR